MNKQTLVSLSLLILLAACQPETQSTLVTASSENSPASAVLAETQVTVSDTASSVVEVASAVAPSAPAAEPVASKVSKNAAANQVSAPAPEVQAPATKPATVAPAPAPAPAAAPAAAAPAATTPVAAAATTPSKSVLSDADGRALAQKNGCFVCHGMDKKIVGPAWKDIATKYRGDASMEAKLITKVSKGGAGAWGSTPMPPNSPRVKAEDISSLVKFILSLQ